MTGKIMVGVDGSEGSRRALAWAIRQAAARGAALQPVIIWQRDVGHGSRQDCPAGEETAEAARQRLQAAVAEVTGPHPAVPVVLLVLEGEPGQVLCVRSAGAELLVVGRRGHGGGLAGLALGPVSAVCARHSRCPVVIVPAAGQEPGPAAGKEHR